MRSREDLPTMEGAIVIIKKPANRLLKRAMLHEYDRIADKLWPVEKSFYEGIFMGRDYRKCYSDHQDWWKSQCEAIEKNHSPRYWLIVSEYFAEKFAPIEAETNLPQPASLMRFARNVLKPISNC